MRVSRAASKPASAGSISTLISLTGSDARPSVPDPPRPMERDMTTRADGDWVADRSRLAVQSAAILFVGTGVVTVINSYVSTIAGVDMIRLRLTGLLAAVV